MTGCFIDGNGDYYEGDQQDAAHVAVPKRPDSEHAWIGGAWVPVPNVPPRATRAQARKALVLAGLFDNVQPSIDAISDPIQRQLVQIDWDDSAIFERNNPTLLMLAVALGLTSAQVDGLFTLADSL